MKLAVAAVQMPAEPACVDVNRERADAWLRHCRDSGVELVVLPEMFNTGYGFLPDFAQIAETLEGPTLLHLRERSRHWNMSIAAGFVERDGHHLYDSLAFVTPDGRAAVYRKRHLVFWERFRFKPGRSPLIVATPWGRLGFAVCADMIYRRVWDDYRDRIDCAVIAAAWPEFAHQHDGRLHWLLGHLGKLSGTIPGKVASDLGIPVIFANQCGPTRTTIPYLGGWVSEKISDRFAGLSSVCDGRHGAPQVADGTEQCLISDVTIHSPRGPKSCRFTFPSDRAVSFSGSAEAGSTSPVPASTGEPAAAAP